MTNRLHPSTQSHGSPSKDGNSYNLLFRLLNFDPTLLIQTRFLATIGMLIFGFGTFHAIVGSPVPDPLATNVLSLLSLWIAVGVLFSASINLYRLLANIYRSKKSQERFEIRRLRDKPEAQISILILNREVAHHAQRSGACLTALAAIFILAIGILCLSGHLVSMDRRSLSAATELETQRKELASVYEKAASLVGSISNGEAPGTATDKDLTKLEASRAKALTEFEKLNGELKARLDHINQDYRTLYRDVKLKEVDELTKSNSLSERLATTLAFRIFMSIFFTIGLGMIWLRYGYHENMRANYIAQKNAIIQSNLDPENFLRKRAVFSTEQELDAKGLVATLLSKVQDAMTGKFMRHQPQVQRQDATTHAPDGADRSNQGGPGATRAP